MQTHEQHDNSMNPRTVGAIALCPMGNAQGSFYFMSISMGRVLNCLHATPLPMPDDVVDRIPRLARQQRGNPGLLFGDRRMNSMDEESVDSSNSETDDDYVADEEEHNEGDDDIELNYDDIEDDDESMGDRSSYINDGVNDVGQPTSPPGEGMGDEHPEEHSMSEEHVEDDHNPTDPDMGPDENPGVVDQENKGVEQECQAASINEKKEKMSTEIDTGEDVMTGQDSEEEQAVQGTPQYNL